MLCSGSRCIGVVAFVFIVVVVGALFTGRKSSFYPLMLEDKQIWEYFARIKATYIVVGPKGIEPFEQEFLTKFVGRHSAFVRQEYSNAGFQVYRITGLPKAEQSLAGI